MTLSETIEELVAQLENTKESVKKLADRVADIDAAMEKHYAPVFKEHEDRLDFVDADVRALHKDLDMLRDEIRELKEETKKDMNILGEGIKRVINRESACGLTVDRIEALVIRMLEKIETDKVAREKLFKEQEEQAKAKAALASEKPSEP